jgi:hypothetical protein
MTLAAMLVTACGGVLMNTSGSDIDAVFADMERAIRESDESLFKQHWHSEGYGTNLVGGSGLEGSRVYEQGARKKWYLKPEMDKVRTVEGVTFVPCDIWAWENERSVDHVDVAIATVDGTPTILGAGEEPEQVDALARRFAKGEALAPPK